MNGIPAWAVPGAKVVCVDGMPSWNYFKGRPAKYSALPVLGEIYTISQAVWHQWPFRSGVGLHLLEIQRAGKVSPYILERFRPLVTRSQEQDVAIFRHHLDGHKVDA